MAGPTNLAGFGCCAGGGGGIGGGVVEPCCFCTSIPRVLTVVQNSPPNGFPGSTMTYGSGVLGNAWYSPPTTFGPFTVVFIGSCHLFLNSCRFFTIAYSVVAGGSGGGELAEYDFLDTIDNSCSPFMLTKNAINGTSYNTITG
jgi:hypothetical protein